MKTIYRRLNSGQIRAERYVSNASGKMGAYVPLETSGGDIEKYYYSEKIRITSLKKFTNTFKQIILTIHK